MLIEKNGVFVKKNWKNNVRKITFKNQIWKKILEKEFQNKTIDNKNSLHN